MKLWFFLGVSTLHIIVANAEQELPPPSPGVCKRVHPYFLRGIDIADILGQDRSMKHVAARGAVSKFSKQFLPTVVSIQTSNFVASFLAPFLTLYAVAFGAYGITGDVLKDKFNLPLRNINYRTALPILLTDLSEYSKIDLNAATALFYSREVKMCPEFIEVLVKNLYTDVRKVDFARPKDAQRAIGQWCAEETRNRFKNPPNYSDDDDDDTKKKAFEFLNVAYMKGPWSQKFDLLDTKKRPFYVNGGKEKLIPTMGVEGVFQHGEISDPPATFVNIPFASKPNDSHIASMFIVLPTKNTDSIAEHQGRFITKNFQLFILGGVVEKIYVQLPKFRLSSKIDFVEPMKRVAKTGQDHLFVPSKTNFEGITESPQLFIDEFVQFSTIEINEEGVEAVAACGCGQPTEFGDEAPAGTGPGPERDESLKSFIVNRPFYALIIGKTDWCTDMFTFRMSG